MVTLVNRAKMSTSTTGTGAITLGSAETGYQSFADAGVAGSDTIRYVIEDGDDWEIGTGGMNAANTTMSRTLIESSTGSKLNLSGSAVVFITAAAEDVFQGELFAENPSSPTAPSATGANAVAIGDGTTASGDDSYAIGNGVTASAARTIAIGEGTNSGGQSVLIGFSTGNTVSGGQAVGIGRFVTASGSGSLAIGGSVAATSNYASAIGRNSSNAGSQAVTGAGAMALGGSYASGTDSFAAAIANNTSSYGATGANSIAMGELAKATGANAVAIGDGASATANFALALGRNSTSSNFHNIAIGESSTASGNRAIGIGRSANATSNYSTALGVNSSASGSWAVTGAGAMALGGSYASGTDSFAAAIGNNTSSYGATGGNSVAIGYQTKATGTYSYAGGRTSTASGYGSISIGISPTASGHSSIALGGRGVWLAQATAQSSIAIGDGARGDIKGKMAFAGYGMGNAGSQGGWYTLYSDTTDATAEAMTTTKSTASSDNQIVLSNNSAYAFHGTIVARQQASGGTASAAWKVEGLIRREGSASTTVLVNSATTALDNTPSWGMALSADTTNGGLKVEATGAASTNIRWVATIHTSEVIY